MADDPLWLVVFCDALPIDSKAGWVERTYGRAVRLLAPGFRHVYAMRRDPAFAGWLIVNPHASRLDPIIQPDGQIIEAGGVAFEAYHYLVDGMVAAGHAHTVTVRRSDPAKWTPRLPTCVGAIKHLLGVTAPLVWTPRQLYLHLRGERDVER